MQKVAALMMLVLWAGCAAQPVGQTQEIEQLRGSVSALQTDVQAAKANITTAQTDIFQLQLHSDPFKSATFDPGEPGGYGRIDTTGGTFLVAVKNVTPYLDGFRVTVNFGN